MVGLIRGETTYREICLLDMQLLNTQELEHCCTYKQGRCRERQRLLFSQRDQRQVI